MALLAANGTTQFNELFLAFSFFIIAAAVMLVALLFKLGIDGRADEIGLLLAVGFRRRRVARCCSAKGSWCRSSADCSACPADWATPG